MQGYLSPEGSKNKELFPPTRPNNVNHISLGSDTRYTRGSAAPLHTSTMLARLYQEYDSEHKLSRKHKLHFHHLTRPLKQRARWHFWGISTPARVKCASTLARQQKSCSKNEVRDGSRKSISAQTRPHKRHPLHHLPQTPRIENRQQRRKNIDTPGERRVPIQMTTPNKRDEPGKIECSLFVIFSDPLPASVTPAIEHKRHTPQSSHSCGNERPRKLNWRWSFSPTIQHLRKNMV